MGELGDEAVADGETGVEEVEGGLGLLYGESSGFTAGGTNGTCTAASIPDAVLCERQSDKDDGE